MRQRSLPPRTNTTCLGRFCLGLALAILATDARADLWDSVPYHVAIELDLAESGLEPVQQQRLRDRLLERLGNRLGLFWDVRFLDDAADAAETSDADAVVLDKRFRGVVRIRGGALGLEIVEHDATLDHDGVPYKARVAEASELPERLYTGLLRAFRPIARFQRNPEDFTRVTLAYRAAELIPASGLGVAKANQLMLPFRRRLGRDGVLLEDGIQQVRWTYLIADAPGEGQPSAKIASHARRPFGARPSARLQLLTLLAPVDPERQTTLRLHAINEPSTPLPGYEVLLSQLGSKELTPLGFSDTEGRVPLPDGGGVRMAHVKCGGLFVASVPVAPGVDDTVTVPLVDERSRLRAELEVTSLREELIDTVARRKILGERIKRLIEDDRLDLAKRLLAELEELPGRTQFGGRLDQAERSVESAHPVARQRLEKLFTNTRKVMNSALDPRETREVSIALSRAQQDAEVREQAESSTEEPTPGG